MNFGRIVEGMLLLTLVGGCNDEAKNSPKIKPAESAKAPASQASAATVPAEAPPAPVPSALAAAPRRAYGPGDMRLDGCVTLGDDGVLHGRKCSSPFPIFGPYADVPPNAMVEVAFKYQSPVETALFSDMVSGMGARFHAGVSPQTVPHQEMRTFGYRVAVPNGTNALETRIGVRSTGPVDFDVSELTINVQ